MSTTSYETFATALTLLSDHAATFQNMPDFARRKDCEGYRWILQLRDAALLPIREQCLKTTDMLEARVLAEAALEIMAEQGCGTERQIPAQWEGNHEFVVAYTLGLIQAYLG